MCCQWLFWALLKGSIRDFSSHEDLHALELQDALDLKLKCVVEKQTQKQQLLPVQNAPVRKRNTTILRETSDASIKHNRYEKLHFICDEDDIFRHTSTEAHRLASFSTSLQTSHTR